MSKLQGARHASPKECSGREKSTDIRATHVRATHASPLRAGPPPRSLGAVVGSFESAATRRINVLRGNPGCPVWQRNYFERVIRDEKELTAIREYIRNNPAKWAMDQENPVNHEYITENNTNKP